MGDAGARPERLVGVKALRVRQPQWKSERQQGQDEGHAQDCSFYYAPVVGLDTIPQVGGLSPVGCRDYYRENPLRTVSFSLLLLLLMCGATQAETPSPSIQLQATEADREAIRALLGKYTKAVSTKDQMLFESLLLNKHISFSHAAVAVKRASEADGTENYEQFRKGVFAGPPFTQRFQDIRITQDGVLADVSLVFINTTANGTSWGWKTLQLLKVRGQWKIASELYTTH
jgi:hypothetical protein